VRKWSVANNVHPGELFMLPWSQFLLMVQSARDVPPCLNGLTDMEDMLIARVKSYMQVRWTWGRQLCYQDHIINFRQDIMEIATRLPRLPDRTDIVIIRKDDVDLSRHVDFTVRRAKVEAALEYKVAHDPCYADLVIDRDALRQLPENGSVVDRIPSCREGRQDGAALPVGPDALAENGEEANEDEQVVGGVVDLGNRQLPEVEQLRRGAVQAVAGTRYEQTIVCLHTMLFPQMLMFLRSTHRGWILLLSLNLLRDTSPGTSLSLI